MPAACVIFPHQLFAGHPGLGPAGAAHADQGAAGGQGSVPHVIRQGAAGAQGSVPPVIRQGAAGAQGSVPHVIRQGAAGAQGSVPHVILTEDSLFFGDPAYPTTIHAQKLMLLRAAMKAFQASLEDCGHQVSYLEYAPEKGMAPLFEAVEASGCDGVTVADPADFLLERRLRKGCQARGLGLTVLDSPGFVCGREGLARRLAAAKHRQTSFYQALRRERGVLMDGDKPRGGKWTFDTANRRPWRAGRDPNPPATPRVEETACSREARSYVARHFPNAPGLRADGSAPPLLWPHTRAQALDWLTAFVDTRLPDFGTYEDAMAGDEPQLFHSLLSPALNLGLLTPEEVLDAAMARKGVPMNSLEGFVRQVLGWREFMRAEYQVNGVRLRNGNHWGHTRDMPRAFYEAKSGLDPVDHVIGKVLATGYCHHIERLMVLGNIFCLCEIHPNAVYRWFMELFVDACDWVMVPNVYGMSQYADGGSLVTKPYLSSSNYIRKMSDYPPGPWCGVWDGLYWRFMAKHRTDIEAVPRLRVMTSHLDRMGAATLRGHWELADGFLSRLR